MLLHVPIGVVVLRRMLSEGAVDAARLAWIAPLVALGLVAAIAALFRVGERFVGSASGR